MTTAPIAVLGAGMVGVCTALHLQQRGVPVVLIDRRESGQETSYGNAGLIQREAVQPYAFPRSWRKILQVILRLGADVNYHPSAMPALLAPLWSYFRYSAPEPLQRQTLAFGALIAHCLTEHQAFIRAAGAQDLVRACGYHEAYRQEPDFQKAHNEAERIAREFGLGLQILTPKQLASAEPALTTTTAGALHWTDPWSVSDPGALVQAYANLFRANGGEFVQAEVFDLRQDSAGWLVRTQQQTISAAQVVVAMGPWSANLVRSLGYPLPLFVKRGYHQHYQSPQGLRIPLLDAETGFVLIPMRKGLRLTTGAEFARLDAPATPVQVGRAEAVARQWLDLGAALPEPPWLGARPCTADMLPVMGPAPRHKGLWFNFGHSHQGFTLGPVAGRLLAEMIQGETPFIDPRPYRVERFA